MDDDDVQGALEFLRKHDVRCTGVPTACIAEFNPEGDIDFDESEKVSHEPIGPNWKKPGSFAQLPKIEGHPDSAWLMHERQDQKGRYKPWLYFSRVNGKYYRVSDSGTGYMPMGAPHNPWQSPMIVRVGNASVVSGKGSKLDMAVLLPDLHKTGFLLKQPLEFMDKPASLFVLCAGLRNTGLAAEFCAKRLHSMLLPKLSARATVWYDYELVELLSEAAKALDKALLESPACFSGCHLALAMLAGCRLMVSSLGNTRCLLCRPSLVASTPNKPQTPAKALAGTPWTAKAIAGTSVHANASGAVGQRGNLLYGRSVCQETLATLSTDWDRELLRVSRATNSFAVLGLTVADIEGGAAAIRRTYRKRSLVVHPDKVDESQRKESTIVFSKLEAAAEAVTAMLQEDSAATVLLARIHLLHDEGRLEADPATAASLLNVKEGCTVSVANNAVDKGLLGPLRRLQHVARQDVERALKILEVAKDMAVRAVRPSWQPSGTELGVNTSQVLGCKDLKVPEALVGAAITTEVILLSPGEPAGLALLSEGAEAVPDAAVAQRLAEHWPGRPRAAALRIALDAQDAEQATVPQQDSADGAEHGRLREAASVVCILFNADSAAEGSTVGTAVGSGMPAAKRTRIDRADRVRISHVLLRWAGLKVDELARPGMQPPERTQAEVERELLELAEALLEAKDPKTLGARFKAAVLARSECSTALNVPHADVGWIEPGSAEPALEAAAFDTQVGGLSDVVLSSRGAHLMYRLA